MVLRSAYVVARGNNGRPVCQHKLPDGVASHTSCGVDMGRWSRSYTHLKLEAILCKQAACRG